MPLERPRVAVGFFYNPAIVKWEASGGDFQALRPRAGK
jgi:hypothetical protein